MNFKYILKKILYSFIIFISICVIIFLMLKLMPTDPVDIILGNKTSESNKMNLRKKLGLDKPVLIQLKDYLIKILTKFDFGESYHGDKQSALSLFLKKIKQTLKLSFLSVFFASFIGIFLGIKAAIYQYTKIDYFIIFFSVIMISLPTFLIGFLLKSIFGVYLGWFPLTGFNNISEMILPVMTISLSLSGSILRITRINMIKTLEQPYIVTAYAKGLNKNTIIYKHALKNASVPIISYIALSFSFLISGSVITEKIFSIRGVGSLIVEHFQQNDLFVVSCCVILLSLLVICVNIILEIICSFLDPKLKLQ
ncbi:ABC transporter permease [Candidatus Phytoplasma prunorum]|uniref:ABC transporter permease n=1 Tax=Candidatus Phytoplasma prunorum TaxID=47565 RepID=UPI002FF18575